MAGARPAGISRVVRHVAVPRRVGGVVPMPSRVSKAVAVMAAAVPAEHELVEIAAQMGAAQAMEGSERPALQVQNTRWIHVSTRWASRTDDLGLVVVVGQAAITAPAIGDSRAPSPRSRQRRHEGCARRNPRSASRMRRGSPSGDSSTAPAMRILPCGLRPCPPAVGSFTVRNGRVASSSRPGPQAGCDPDRHGTAQLVSSRSQALL